MKSTIDIIRETQDNLNQESGEELKTLAKKTDLHMKYNRIEEAREYARLYSDLYHNNYTWPRLQAIGQYALIK